MPVFHRVLVGVDVGKSMKGATTLPAQSKTCLPERARRTTRQCVAPDAHIQRVNTRFSGRRPTRLPNQIVHGENLLKKE